MTEAHDPNRPNDIAMFAPGNRKMAVITPQGDVLIDWPSVEFADSAGSGLALALAKLALAIRDNTWKPLHITGTINLTEPDDRMPRAG